MSKQQPLKNSGPQIVGFVCNWGAYSGVEMAGAEKREYSAGVKLVKLPCLGRINLGHILKAFEMGAGGIALLGCPPEDCNYESGTERAREVFTQAKDVLHLLGIDPRRLAFIEVPVGGGSVVATALDTFTKQINKLEIPVVKMKDKETITAGRGR